MSENYSIKEIAEIFGITTNKIRFYEKKGLIEPIREANNKYRRFNEEDIIRLQTILLYRSIGLSIEIIGDILKNNEKKNALNHFNNQWELINNEIHRLNIIRKSLENIIDKSYEEENYSNIKEDLLEIIAESNKLDNIRNSWKDKWNFNNWAKSYDRDIKKDNGELKIYKNYEIILQKVYDLAIRLETKNPKILEIGIGTGNLGSKFLESGYEIIGIDQSREMLAVAKEKFPKLKIRIEYE
ncbi:MAG: MerR family transcriptional regulator [Clostridium sp.]